MKPATRVAFFTVLTSFACAPFGSPARGDRQVKTLADFEQPADLKAWEFKSHSAELSDRHATHGSKSLKISADEYMFWYKVPRDWSGYDALEADVFLEGGAPAAGSVLVGDEAWQKKGGSYWNRHNGSFGLKPGANVVSIPVGGLYRGEAGSRNADIKSNIDPAAVVRFDLGFKTKGPATIYLDNLRLVKESRPEGILAFDFGPESQVLAPGFTAVGPRTVYGRNGAAAGLRHEAPSGRARDDTFPTRLYQDFISMGGEEFLVDLPAKDDAGGARKYGVWIVYDDCGYWGGEQARFRRRWVEANGARAWAEDRGPGGPADYLYRFEKVEPKPGDSAWDLYARGLFKPARFETTAPGGKLSLRFHDDGDFGSKVAAVIVYPASPAPAKAAAEQWVAEVEARNRQEFESRAVFLGPAAAPLDVPAEAKAKGWWVGYPPLEQDVTFADAPGPAGTLERAAAQGQRVSFTFAVRQLKDAPPPASPDAPAPAEVRLSAGDLEGPTGVIPRAQIDCRYVHHAVHRGYNDIAYTVGPETLRPVEGAGLRLGENLTRQFWVTLHVPPGTPAGAYRGQIILSAGAVREALPLTVRVLGFPLDEPDYLMAFYGADVPREVSASRGESAWRDLFKLLREQGMNTLSGGPGIPFAGLDAAGKPVLDFSRCDAFFRLARETGFTKTLNGYPGLSMVQGLHDGYVIGQTGRDWEKKTGKPFGELLKLVWSAVRDHAELNHWPAVQVNLCDEPRVIEAARAELELMRAYQENVPWVNIGGSYSVHWNADPLEKVIQEMFKTLHWSALNLHTQADLDKAKELGKELLIYNQGATRYSFGAYQWAEARKGVRGRFQWHLLALHGYQFFDLDGREPDTAMMNWGEKEIIPTIKLPRCREGADDFRYAVTLWNLAEKTANAKQNAPGSAQAAAEAKAWLEDAAAKIAVGQNKRPAGFMDDEAFRAGCIERIENITAAQN